MLSSPAGLSDCLREWDDLEKDYQQIQVNETVYYFIQLWSNVTYGCVARPVPVANVNCHAGDAGLRPPLLWRSNVKLLR